MGRQNLIDFLFDINRREVSLNNYLSLVTQGKEYLFSPPSCYSVSLKKTLNNVLMKIAEIQIGWGGIYKQLQNNDNLISIFRDIKDLRTETEIKWASKVLNDLIDESEYHDLLLKLDKDPEYYELDECFRFLGRVFFDIAEKTIFILNQLSETKKYLLYGLDNSESLIFYVWDMILEEDDQLLDDSKFSNLNTNEINKIPKTSIEKRFDQLESGQELMLDYLMQITKLIDEQKKELDYPDSLLVDEQHIKPYQGKFIVLTSLARVLDFSLKNGFEVSIEKIRSYYLSKKKLPFSESTMSQELARARSRFRDNQDL